MADAELRATFVSNLRYAAAELKQAGLRLQIEPVRTTQTPAFDSDLGEPVPEFPLDQSIDG